eukprot:962667-Pelagomonas_calceolata.AAC.1
MSAFETFLPLSFLSFSLMHAARPGERKRTSTAGRPRQPSSNAQDSAGNYSHMGPSQEVWDFWGTCLVSKLWEWASTWESSREALLILSRLVSPTEEETCVFFHLNAKHGLLSKWFIASEC